MAYIRQLFTGIDFFASQCYNTLRMRPFYITSLVTLTALISVSCQTNKNFPVNIPTEVRAAAEQQINQMSDNAAPRKVYPEAERKAAMQELLNRYRTIHGLLMGIHDKDSALAAMEKITPLVAKEECEQLRSIAETSYTTWGFFEIILTEEQLEAYLLQEKRIEESYYYGVDSLRNFLFKTPCD